MAIQRFKIRKGWPVKKPKFLTKKEDDFEIIADIDAVITKALGFKAFGQNHRLKPLTTETFLLYTEAMQNLLHLPDDVKSEEVIQAYFKVVSSICDTVTMEQIKKAEKSQLAALFQVVVDHSMGKTKEIEKKKDMMTQVRLLEKLNQKSETLN